MFHSQALIGLALLPVAWATREAAANDPAATTRAGGAARADFDRHFPAGWSRDTVDLLAAAVSALARVKSRWQTRIRPGRRSAS